MSDAITLTIPPGCGHARALAAMTAMSWPKLDQIGVIDSNLPKVKRKRMPSATYAARLAKREGVEVKRSPDGTLTMKPIKKTFDITPANDTDTDSFNEWDTVQ